VAESHTIHSRACARKHAPTPQLEFCQSLAMQMMNNTIYDDGTVVSAPMRAKMRSTASEGLGHELCHCPNYTGYWKLETNTWSKWKTQYG